MRDIVHSLIFSFKEILHWSILKYIFISGSIVSLFWIFIGYLLWSPIVLLGSYILELIPFSMIRSNGAWMLSSLLWFQLVLITFALIFAFFGNFIIQNFSKEKYPSFSIIVIICSAIFWSIVWIFQGEYIYQQFLKLLTWLPFETIEKAISYMIGFYIIYSAIIVTMLFIASLFNKQIIKEINTRHFINDTNVKGHAFKSFEYTIKDILIFSVASLVAFPLFFIPIINFIVVVILWVWLIKNTFKYNAMSMVFDKIDNTDLKKYDFATLVISFIAALFNFVPILNLFGPFFGEIAMFHYIKSQK